MLKELKYIFKNIQHIKNIKKSLYYLIFKFRNARFSIIKNLKKHMLQLLCAKGYTINDAP